MILDGLCRAVVLRFDKRLCDGAVLLLSSRILAHQLDLKAVNLMEMWGEAGRINEESELGGTTHNQQGAKTKMMWKLLLYSDRS